MQIRRHSFTPDLLFSRLHANDCTAIAAWLKRQTDFTKHYWKWVAVSRLVWWMQWHNRTLSTELVASYVASGHGESTPWIDCECSCTIQKGDANKGGPKLVRRFSPRCHCQRLSQSQRGPTRSVRPTWIYGARVSRPPDSSQNCIHQELG